MNGAWDTVVDVRGLRMRYGSRDVLGGVDFRVGRGEVITLLGPNGAGKTTTIEILEGFRMRSAGEVAVLGVDPARADERWRARIGVASTQGPAGLPRPGAPPVRPGGAPGQPGGHLHGHGPPPRAGQPRGGARVTHPIVYAARLGLSRGWTEFRHTLASPADLGWNLFLVAVFMVVLLFQRNARVDGATLPLAMLTLPGMLGLVVAMGGFQGAGIVLLPDLATAGRSGWPTLLWVLGLGLLATMPWGAILGSLVKSPNAAFGLAMLPSLALAAISGIFYPITTLPGWVQAVAQAFPICWLGLGIRSALLPDAAAALELTGSWRHLETAVVLGAWAVAGLLLAPAVLRRMARRESGSSMEARRHQHLQRV